ncbi:MAG: hypothetical protein U5R06_03330 [candidate division KSB1 bacterium]|nr:hypothetical protein [candidate division KSB1 bacterium]
MMHDSSHIYIAAEAVDEQILTADSIDHLQDKFIIHFSRCENQPELSANQAKPLYSIEIAPGKEGQMIIRDKVNLGRKHLPAPKQGTE